MFARLVLFNFGPGMRSAADELAGDLAPRFGAYGAASQSPFSVMIWTVSTDSLCYGIHRKTRTPRRA